MDTTDIDTLVKAAMQSCGLDINQAKTIIYYSTATYALEKLNMMPILVIQGPQGTGKSTTIKFMKGIVYNPVSIDGKVSAPVLRDSLQYNSTVFIEEADNVDEQWILERYSKQTAYTIVKRQDPVRGFLDRPMNTFGATVLHRRVPFRDAAVESRSVVIHTQYRAGVVPISPLTGEALKAIAEQVLWDKQTAIQLGRASDSWQPLLQAAAACKDYDWFSYATNEIYSSHERFIRGHGYEPRQALIYTLYALSRPEVLLTASKPVKVSDVKNHLKTEYEVTLNNRQIEEMCLRLGFKLTRPHGFLTVQPNDELLQQLIKNIEQNG